MDVQTYFFRRKNMNAKGEPRSWTDHLLWHHAAHTVDLFQHQTGDEVIVAHAVQGPIHTELGIAMDMSIQLKTKRGAICTLSLSFNNVSSPLLHVCLHPIFLHSHNHPSDMSLPGHLLCASLAQPAHTRSKSSHPHCFSYTPLSPSAHPTAFLPHATPCHLLLASSCAVLRPAPSFCAHNFKKVIGSEPSP
jgi:hypothetical protein